MTGATWTPAELRTRLAISTAVYQKVRLGARQIAEIREAGIQKIELSCVAGCFDYQDQQQALEVLNACKAEDVEIVALHGPFKLPYGEETEEARKRVVSESLPAIRLAEEAGAGIYVGHFGREEARRTHSPARRAPEAGPRGFRRGVAGAVSCCAVGPARPRLRQPAARL